MEENTEGFAHIHGRSRTNCSSPDCCMCVKYIYIHRPSSLPILGMLQYPPTPQICLLWTSATARYSSLHLHPWCVVWAPGWGLSIIWKEAAVDQEPGDHTAVRSHCCHARAWRPPQPRWPRRRTPSPCCLQCSAVCNVVQCSALVCHVLQCRTACLLHARVAAVRAHGGHHSL